MEKYKSFIPSQFLNTRTEQWQNLDEMYEGRNFLELVGFVKIIPVTNNIYLIVWDEYDCSTTNTLYKGILE